MDLYDFKRSVLHLFYPTRCPVCGSLIDLNGDFCKDCRGRLSVYRGTFSVGGADGFTASFEYDEVSSPAIILMKKGIAGNAPYALGKALAGRLREEGIAEKTDVIVSVPLHRSSRRKRGLDQAQLIADEVGRRLEIPVLRGCLAKTVRTLEQKELDREERAVNLKGVFQVVKPELIRGRAVLVVDDVCTTGSTLAELTKELLENGAAKVYCAACCKTMEK